MLLKSKEMYPIFKYIDN